MKIVREIIFWLAVLGVLVLVFGYRISDFSGAFLFTSFLLPVLIGSSYTFSEFLIPKYLLAKKYFRFSLYAVYTIIIALNLTILVMVLSFSVIANYRFDNMLPASRDVFGLALVILFIALVKSSWKLVKKLFVQETELHQLTAKDKLHSAGYLNVKANRKEYRIPLADIYFIESLSDYIRIIRGSGEPVVSRERISVISERLPGNFLRIHRSYVINLEHSHNFTAETVKVSDTELPIGRKFKAAVLEILKTREA